MCAGYPSPHLEHDRGACRIGASLVAQTNPVATDHRWAGTGPKAGTNAPRIVHMSKDTRESIDAYQHDQPFPAPVGAAMRAERRRADLQRRKGADGLPWA